MTIHTCIPGTIYRCGRCKQLNWTADGFVVELDKVPVCPKCMTRQENVMVKAAGEIMFKRREPE